MLSAASNLRKHVLDKFYSDETFVDVPISIDGSWQKRYRFNSLFGVVLLSNDIIDYVVKSLVCFTCKKNKDSPHTWKASHVATCCINHHESAGKMEMDGRVEIFLRSIEKRKLRWGWGFQFIWLL